MNKKAIILICVVVVLIIVSLRFSFAINVRDEISTGSADITYDIDIEDIRGTDVVVNAGKTKEFDLVLTNSGSSPVGYWVAYSGTKPSTVRIAQLSGSLDLVHGVVKANAKNQITIVIENNSSSNYTYTIMPVIGYENSSEFNPPSGYTLIKDIYRYELSGDPNEPKLADNMIPVMYYNNKWVKADTQNINGEYQWYDYYSKKWANAVLVSSTNRSTYVNANAGSEIPESDILAYYVWIPRFKYKVPNINKVINTYSYNAPVIGVDIRFEQGTQSTGTINCSYDITVTDGSLSETCTGKNGQYYTHPAFTFGDDELEGIWVGKFELSSSTPTATNGGGNSTSLTVRVKPNVSSWRSNRIGNYFKVVYDMQTSSNIYGLSTNRNLVDSHLIKNLEWGAVALFTHSYYGRCRKNSCDEVTKNNSSDYITGNAGDTVYDSAFVSGVTNSYNFFMGQKASTTGNIYGIYDMSGGAVEYTMGNMSSTAGSYTYSQGNAGTNYTYTGYEKYIDIYANGSTKNDQTAFNRSRLGDAVGEIVVQKNSSSSWGWNLDYAINVYSTYVFFIRGGYANTVNTNVGVFYTSCANGGTGTNITSRSVLVVM